MNITCRSLSDLRCSQQGSALAVGLLFLIILTLLGLTASSGAITQEMITRNTKDNVLAMQVAEAGLRSAESWIRSNGQPKAGTGPVQGPGYCDSVQCLDWDEATWKAKGTMAEFNPGQQAPNGIEPPYYVIEVHYVRSGFGWDTSETYFYKVYSRGTGKNPDTVRILSSIYRY